MRSQFPRRSLANSATIAALAACLGAACVDIETLPPITTTSTSAGGSTSTGGDSTSSSAAGAGGAGGASTSSTDSTSSSTPPPLSFTAVFTILLENHDYNEIIGSPDAPYINSLADQYSLATNYFDCGVHPSLPNYLYLVSGDTQYPGGSNVGPEYAPFFPSPADNLGMQMELAGIAWRSYQESMPTPCHLTDAWPYVPRHNPFPYFANIQDSDDGLCALRNVDYSLFAADLAAGANRFYWITPNQIHNGHDPIFDPPGALRESDEWLSVELPKILASDAYTSGGVVFVTWDEAEGRNGNDLHQVPMIVISPKLKSPGMKVATRLDHGAWLATMEDLFDLPRLGAAASSPTLFEFFEDAAGPSP